MLHFPISLMIQSAVFQLCTLCISEEYPSSDYRVAVGKRPPAHRYSAVIFIFSSSLGLHILSSDILSESRVPLNPGQGDMSDVTCSNSAHQRPRHSCSRKLHCHIPNRTTDPQHLCVKITGVGWSYVAITHLRPRFKCRSKTHLRRGFLIQCESSQTGG